MLSDLSYGSRRGPIKLLVNMNWSRRGPIKLFMNAVNMNWNRRSPINMRRADMKFAIIGWGPICDLLLMNEQFMNGQLMS